MSDNATISDRPAIVRTGYMGGNPSATLGIFMEADTLVSISTHVVEDGVQRIAEPDEVTAGNYHCSVVQLGTGGVNIYAHREDLVRLLVKLSDHLEMLDRADTTDRRVAEREAAK